MELDTRLPCAKHLDRIVCAGSSYSPCSFSVYPLWCLPPDAFEGAVVEIVFASFSRVLWKIIHFGPVLLRLCLGVHERTVRFDDAALLQVCVCRSFFGLPLFHSYACLFGPLCLRSAIPLAVFPLRPHCFVPLFCCFCFAFAFCKPNALKL
jgi:hypothetical protein